jgi:5-hydroxyisourate hydrolase-like protein (transthyretin family)
MIRSTRGFLSAAAVVALVCLGVSIGGGSAGATTSPTYEPDPAAIGTLAFYDSSGNQITSGTLDPTGQDVSHPMAAYYLASGHGVSGDTNAQVAFATPQDNVPTASWTTVNLQTSSQSYPPPANNTYPGILHTTTNALVKGDDFGLGFQMSTNPNSSTNDPNIFQIRVYTVPSLSYYTADVVVSGTAWTQIYPAVLTPTTTTLAASPNPSAIGQSVTLTATVTPNDVPGSVQFKDGTTNLGTPVTVAAGQAQKATSFAIGGSHSLHAVFTPTDTGTFATSTGNVTQVVTADNSAMTISRSMTIKYGASVTTSTTIKDSTSSTPIGGIAVQLQRKSGATWVLVGTANTSSSGVASKSVKPTGNIQYRWTFAGNSSHKTATSPTQTVSVTQVVSAHSTKSTIKHRIAFKIWGTVNPPSSGQKVTLQDLVGKLWKNIATVTIKKQKLPNGATTVGFVFTLNIAKASIVKYRVYRPATSTLLAGYSGTLTVKAT